MSEYSLCLAIVLIAILGINMYVKRGLQGRYKDAVTGVTTAASAKTQYEPYYLVSENIMDRSLTTNKVGQETVKRTISSEPATMKSTTTESAGTVGAELEEGSTVIEVK